MKYTLILLCVLIAGCASKIPDIASDCNIHPYKQMWEEAGKTVDDCKLASEKKEERAFMRAQEKIQFDLDAAKCMREGRAWVVTIPDREGICKHWEML